MELEEQKITKKRKELMVNLVISQISGDFTSSINFNGIKR